MTYKPEEHWSVSCGCEAHGDHLACTEIPCQVSLGCVHPTGRYVTTKKEKWADRYSGVPVDQVPKGRVKVRSPYTKRAKKILAALDAYEQARHFASTEKGRLRTIEKILEKDHG